MKEGRKPEYPEKTPGDDLHLFSAIEHVSHGKALQEYAHNYYHVTNLEVLDCPKSTQAQLRWLGHVFRL